MTERNVISFQRTPKAELDWREKILADLPDEWVVLRCRTFTTAEAIIKTAAYNRRMNVEDFIGRAALAVAVHDAEGDPSWVEATEKEIPLTDLRRRGLPARRLRGHGFGPWVIERMSDG